jgi:hypothetical protein
VGLETSGGDQRRALAGAAGDAGKARGGESLGQGRRCQDGGEPPGQHGLARPGRADEEDVVGRAPAFRSLLDPPCFVRGVPPKPPNVQGDGRDAGGAVPLGPRVVG